MSDLLNYEKMVGKALLGVVRQSLDVVAQHGLYDAHHFYITFRTQAPGVIVAPHIIARYPDEMTIVLQHQFWGLSVDDVGFSVNLSFSGKSELLVIPFNAITAFADPSAKFGLQFQVPDDDSDLDEPEEIEPESPVETDQVKDAGSEDNVVVLDAFRKR